ncbi:MAG: hypothetical protein JRN20_03200 [Nitrososphaerota archaeon]|nr:hypothetical protein [Nitrososphaerota archaeon]
MGKKTFILAVIIIVIGVALIVYHDPQFRFAYNAITGTTAKSSTPSSTGGFPGGFTGGFPGGSVVSVGSSSSSQAISTAFSALDILESVLGAGLIGVGLVLASIAMFSIPIKSKD